MDMSKILNKSDSLTLGTIGPVNEVLRLMNKIKYEKHAVTRRALVSAVADLVNDIRKHEDQMEANNYRVR